MNAFTQGNIACAERNVRNAIELLDHYSAETTPDPWLIAAARAELLDATGRLAAAAQLEEIEREMGSADTERPRHLTVVR